MRAGRESPSDLIFSFRKLALFSAITSNRAGRVLQQSEWVREQLDVSGPEFGEIEGGQKLAAKL